MFHIQRKSMSNVNVSLTKSNFEGKLSTNEFGYCWFLAVSGAKNLLLNISTLIMQKNYIFPGEWELQFL